MKVTSKTYQAAFSLNWTGKVYVDPDMAAKMAMSWSCKYQMASGSSLWISSDKDPEEESEDSEDLHWVESVESRR
jgi:hypothetical protein